MATFSGVSISDKSDNKEIVDAIIAQSRTMEYYLSGNLDSENVREIGGWRVGPTQLTSKDLDVGMSTDDSQVENIRFWAGSSTKGTADFRVYDSGRVVANNIQISGGDIVWGDVAPPSYADLFGPKPPADANNTYNELLFNTGIRGFVNVGGTLYLSADYIRAGTITSVTYNAFDPSTPNRRLQIRPSNVDGVPDMSFWNESSTTTPRGAIYVTTGNFNGDGTHNYFSVWGSDRMQITSSYVWFNAGTVDFSDTTVKGVFAKFA